MLVLSAQQHHISRRGSEWKVNCVGQSGQQGIIGHVLVVHNGLKLLLIPLSGLLLHVAIHAQNSIIWVATPCSHSISEFHYLGCYSM